MERKTILLVEDNDMVRKTFKSALEKSYNVLEASGYYDTIKQLTEHIDLALVNSHLPDADGFEVLNILRTLNPGLPVIIMTAFDSENLAIEALRHNASDFIEKPVELAYLRKKVAEVLEGQ